MAPFLAFFLAPTRPIKPEPRWNIMEDYSPGLLGYRPYFRASLPPPEPLRRGSTPLLKKYEKIFEIILFLSTF
jgi:hypothetical protein